MSKQKPVDWTASRLVEPSTHTAVAVFLAVLALYFDHQMYDPNPYTGWLLLGACFEGFLGIILKEGKGLIR